MSLVGIETLWAIRSAALASPHPNADRTFCPSDGVWSTEWHYCPPVSADPSTLAEPLRTALAGLMQEAAQRGATVTVVSARRSRDQQIALRRANCGPTDDDIYRKPSMQCTPPTAVPGTSEHEKGRAVDLGGDLDVVAQLAPKYGLVATVPGEPWHYEHQSTARGGAPELEIGPGVSPGALIGAGVNLGANVVGGVAGGVAGGLESLGNLASAVTSARFWLRVLAVLAGGALIAVGFVGLGLDLRGGAA